MPDDRRDEPDVRQPLADEQAAVDARQPDRVAAHVAQRGDELAVDDAAEHGRGDLERRGIGHPQPALEVRRDAEPLEPLGHALAAAVDEHDRPLAGDRGDLGEDLPLVRERRPARA